MIPGGRNLVQQTVPSIGSQAVSSSTAIALDLFWSVHLAGPSMSSGLGGKSGGKGGGGGGFNFSMNQQWGDSSWGWGESKGKGKVRRGTRTVRLRDRTCSAPRGIQPVMFHMTTRFVTRLRRWA